MYVLNDINDNLLLFRYLFHKSLLVFLTFCKFQNNTANTHSIRKDLKIYLSILKDSWMYQLAIFITFVVTLAVFPAVTALVQPLSKGMEMQK